jgi:molybdopterin molybdotransferase
MISVNEAKDIIRNNVEVLPSIKIPLADAVGYVLAEDVFSKIEFPPFNQSNVDGYAIAFKDAKEILRIDGEVAAGDKKNFVLNPQRAMRIYTGAVVPENADTIVMQEKVTVENNVLIIHDEQLCKGENFRAKGKDIQQGALALQKNEVLSAGAVGFLSGLGITEVSVYKKPSIGIIITGNELQQPGKKLQHGQVYEANSFMLKAALQQLYFNDIRIFYADDNLEKLTCILKDVLGENDMVLLCGGISVGDYDFVLEACNNCGVETLFHKVKQKPGKPLYFGKKGDKAVFGLPGNPSSVLTCFYEYVAESLSIMTKRKSFIEVMKVAMANDYNKKSELSFFLKGILGDGKVIALDAQESYRLSSYAKANCLIKLDEVSTGFLKGELVEVHILPN